MMYRTGACYVTGLVGGGLVGAVQGYQAARANKVLSQNFKLTLNSVLNGAGRLSSKTSNHFGVFSFVFSLVRGISREQRGTVDYKNEVAGVGAAATLVSLTSTLIVRCECVGKKKK